MKKLIGLLIATGVGFGAFAQSKIRGNISSSPVRSNTTKVVVVPRSAFYSPYGYGFRNFGYSPYGYGFGYNPMFGFNPVAEAVPTQLELEIEQIKSDFSHDISAIRHNSNLPKSERKQLIRDKKHERESAVIAAKQAWYGSSKNRN